MNEPAMSVVPPAVQMLCFVIAGTHSFPSSLGGIHQTEVGAVFFGSARTDLCGECRATGIPTAIEISTGHSKSPFGHSGREPDNGPAIATNGVLALQDSCPRDGFSYCWGFELDL